MKKSQKDINMSLAQTIQSQSHIMEDRDPQAMDVCIVW